MIQQASKQGRKAFGILLLLAQLLCLAVIVWPPVDAKPCVAQTALFGPKTSTNYTELYVDEDDTTRIIQMNYCVKLTGSTWQHFRGFEAIVQSATNTFTQTYGTLNEPGDECRKHYFGTEEITHITTYSDSNDVEGLVIDGHKGGQWVLRANGDRDINTFVMGGRPIGFGVYMGRGGTNNQPLQIRIMYNSCNCPASYFTGTQQPADQSTKVRGTASQSTLSYQENYMEAIYGQNCGTYTVTLSPNYSFITLSKSGATGGRNNLAYWDKITLQSNSPIDIGQYEVLMTVSQTGASDGFSTPYSGSMPSISYKFKATVNPCETTYSSVIQTPKITYTIGANSLTTGTYAFAQSPDCGYSDFVTFTPALPFYTRHNRATKDFTIMKTENRGLAGTTTITFKGYVLEPDDYTTVTYTEKKVEYTFDIEMIDPCATTTIDDWPIADMRTSVFGSADVQQLTTPLDSVAKLYGDTTGATYCGQKLITITSVTPAAPTWSGYLNLDTTSAPKFTAQTTTPSHQGSYTIQVEIKMADYTSIKQTKSFTVVIDACQVTTATMTQTAVASQTYNIHFAKLSFTWADFGIGRCTYSIDYTFSLYNVGTGASQAIPVVGLIAKTNGDRTFEVQSTNSAHVGVYEVRVTGTTPVGKMSPQLSETLAISLTVTDTCATDLVTPTSTIPSPQQYTVLAAPTTLTHTPTWSTSTVGCAVTYEIRRIDGGVERVLNGAETAVITFDNSNGKLDISTSNAAFKGTIWKIKVFKKSTHGTPPNSEGIYLFDLEFIDECRDATLVGSEPRQTFYEFDLNAKQEMFASPMTNGGVNCGGFTYELEYIGGPQAGQAVWAAGLYTITEPGDIKIAVSQNTISAQSWLGDHIFRLKSTNGKLPATLHSSKYSVNFTVRISEPCPTTVVNGDGGVKIGDIAAPSTVWTYPGGNPGTIDASASTTTFATSLVNGPTDTQAVTLGNGYNLCGYLEYAFFEQDQVTPFNTTTIMDITVNKREHAMDQFYFTVYTYGGGYLRTDRIYLGISLMHWPTAKPTLLPFNVVYRLCRPGNFRVWPIDDYLYPLGESSQMMVYSVDQTPCPYKIGEYKCTHVVSLSPFFEQNLPNFITSETAAGVPKLWWETSDADDVGTYRIRCYGSILRRGEVIDTTSVDFKITVLPIAQQVGPNDTPTAPQWDMNLQDQTANVGENLIYPVEIKETAFGSEMNIKVDKGTAKEFLDWDEDTQEFKVHEGAALERHVGAHVVCMEVSFKNSTYEEKHNDCFILTIQSNLTNNATVVPDRNVTWVPSEKPIQEPVEQFIVSEYGLELGPYNERQPVPYIADLSVSGVLTIGWDRSMTPRDDFQEINPSRVAIKNAEDVTKAQNQVVETGDATVLPGQQRRSLQGRNLLYRHEGLYMNETTQEEQWLLVVEALELRMGAGDYSDENKLNFTWEMKMYSKEAIQIQLLFDYPQRVSEYIEYDTLEVYFWGVDWFKSEQEEPVRYGTKLARPIIRQIDPSLAEWLGVFGHILSTVSALLMLIAAMSSGRMLPTWLFLESLQLMSHLPLFKTQLPAPAAYFMSKFIELTRFNLLTPLIGRFAQSQGHFSEGALNMTFEAYGYASMYLGGNMPMIIILSAAIIILTVIGLIKLFWVRSTNQAITRAVRQIVYLNDHFAWMVNFAVRFYCETFLIICMSSIIAFSKNRQENVIPEYNAMHDPESSHARYDAMFAALALALITLSILYLIARQAWSLAAPTPSLEQESEASPEQEFTCKNLFMRLYLGSCLAPDNKNRGLAGGPGGEGQDEDNRLRPINMDILERDRRRLIKLRKAAGKDVSKLGDIFARLDEESKKGKSEDKSELSEIKEVVEQESSSFFSISSNQSINEDRMKNVELSSLSSRGARQRGKDIEDSVSDIDESHLKLFRAPFENSQRDIKSRNGFNNLRKNDPSSRNQLLFDDGARSQGTRDTLGAQRRTQEEAKEVPGQTTHSQALNLLKFIQQEQLEGGEEIVLHRSIEQLFWSPEDKAAYQKGQQQRQQKFKERAQKRVHQERRRQHAWPQKYPKTRTLGYGISVGITDSLIDTYWLIYVLRRIIYALILINLYDQPSIGVCTFLVFVLANFSLLSFFRLWEENHIALHHFVNECFLGLLALILIVVSNGFILSYDEIDIAGNFVIYLVVVYVVFNWVMIIYDAVLILQLHFARMKGILKHRETRYTIGQVNKVTEKAQAYLVQLALSGEFHEGASKKARKESLFEAKMEKRADQNLPKASQFDSTQAKVAVGDDFERSLGAGTVLENDGLLDDNQTIKPDLSINDSDPQLINLKTKPRKSPKQPNQHSENTILHAIVPAIPTPKPESSRDKKDKRFDDEQFDMHLDAIEENFRLEEQLNSGMMNRRNSRTQHFYLHSEINSQLASEKRTQAIGLPQIMDPSKKAFADNLVGLGLDIEDVDKPEKKKLAVSQRLATPRNPKPANKDIETPQFSLQQNGVLRNQKANLTGTGPTVHHDIMGDSARHFHGRNNNWLSMPAGAGQEAAKNRTAYGLTDEKLASKAQNLFGKDSDSQQESFVRSPLASQARQAPLISNVEILPQSDSNLHWD